MDGRPLGQCREAVQGQNPAYRSTRPPHPFTIDVEKLDLAVDEAKPTQLRASGANLAQRTEAEVADDSVPPQLICDIQTRCLLLVQNPFEEMRPATKIGGSAGS